MGYTDFVTRDHRGEHESERRKQSHLRGRGARLHAIEL